MKPATAAGAFLLALIALGHLLRVLLGWTIDVNDMVIPMWPSVLVVIVFGLLATVICREHR